MCWRTTVVRQGSKILKARYADSGFFHVVLNAVIDEVVQVHGEFLARLRLGWYQ